MNFTHIINPKSLLKYTLFLSIAGMILVGFNSCSPKYGCPALEGQADIEAGKTPKSTSGLVFGDTKKNGKRKKVKKKKK